MKTENSKLVLGLLAGAAIGAAVAYLLTTDKKEQWVEDAGCLLGKAKESLADMADSVKEAVDNVKCNCKVPEIKAPAETVVD